MKRFTVCSALAASLIAMAAPAYATNYVVALDGDGNGAFAKIKPPSGAFSDKFTFTTGSGFVSADGTTTVLGVGTDIDFTKIVLNGVELVDGVNGFLSNDVFPSKQSTFSFFLPVATGPNPQVLEIFGNSLGGKGTYSGNIYFAAVPEASTWGMMIAGFGIAGGALRRRQKVQAKINFA